VATAESAQPVVACLDPCYTTIPLPEDDDGRISADALSAILDAVADNDAVAIGPGLGQSPGLRSMIETLLEQAGLRLVIDGDGLNNLSKLGSWPHPGEMLRLWSGLFREAMPTDRQQAAAQMAETAGVTVALKGADTVVTDGQRVFVNNTGNPGMATAGSGDVLTGMIVSLMGQGLGSFDATVLGVHVHGMAGDVATARLGQISVTATDIIEALPEAFRKSNHFS
jgi:NAD(P)H-hydrate epimerase